MNISKSITKSREFNSAIELFRIISTVFIVAFHSKFSLDRDVFYSGLVFFICTSVYLNAKSIYIHDYHLKTFNRLITPWIFWCLVYGVLNLTVSKPWFGGNQITLASILIGTHVHLWYLPFMFISLNLLNLLHLQFREEQLFKIALFCYVLLMLSAFKWRPASLGFVQPFPQYMHALPIIFIALSIRYVLSQHEKVIVFLILVSTTLCIQFNDLFMPYIIGFVMFYIAIRYQYFFNFLPESIKKLSDLSFGIYLVHPFFLAVCSSYKVSLGVVYPLFVYSFAAFGIWAMKKYFPFMIKFI